MPRFEETHSAKLIRERVYQQAGDVAKRIKTLDRFFEAVEAIASGDAFIMARDHEMLDGVHQIDPKRFRVKGKVPPAAIEAYVRMRQMIDGPGSSWTGPKGEMIRGDVDLRTYLVERFAVPSAAGGSPIDRNVDEVINSLKDLSAQSVIRAHLEELKKRADKGKEAKVQRDLAKRMFRNVEGKDFDELTGQTGFNPKSPSDRGLAGSSRTVLQGLVRRLFDNEFLKEFELRYEKGRVEQDVRPFSQLVYPEELKLLATLCGRSVPQ